jgi:hypothetical protein
MTASERYSTAAAFRMALEERLRQTAVVKGETWLTYQRKRLVFDRLLARLLVAAPNRWILKGAVALDFRLGERARSTMDLDLAHQQDADAATGDLLAAQAVQLDDYFSFRIEQPQNLGEATEGTIRYRVRADVDGRRFDVVTLDVGFTHARELTSTTVRGPDLLGFAGIPPIEVPAIPLEDHVAEKLHAYTRDFGDRQNTRVKDLIDLILISSEITFEASKLRQAIDHTFGARDVQRIPGCIATPPDNWPTPYRRMAAETGLEPDIAIGHAAVAKFLDPILANAVSPNARWAPDTRAWKEPDDSSSSG